MYGSQLTGTLKKCNKCGEEKDLMHFPVNRKCNGGRGGGCKTCINSRKSKKRVTNGLTYVGDTFHGRKDE